jgi:hypothetical protein
VARDDPRELGAWRERAERMTPIAGQSRGAESVGDRWVAEPDQQRPLEDERHPLDDPPRPAFDRVEVGELIAKLAPANHAIAVELARIPEEIRGFGHVKEANLHTAKAKEAALLEEFRSPPPSHAIAAE